MQRYVIYLLYMGLNTYLLENEEKKYVYVSRTYFSQTFRIAACYEEERKMEICCGAAQRMQMKFTAYSITLSVIGYQHKINTTCKLLTACKAALIPCKNTFGSMIEGSENCPRPSFPLAMFPNHYRNNIPLSGRRQPSAAALGYRKECLASVMLQSPRSKLMPPVSHPKNIHRYFSVGTVECSRWFSLQ